jgi:hypothetical protein
MTKNILFPSKLKGLVTNTNNKMFVPARKCRKCKEMLENARNVRKCKEMQGNVRKC